MAERETMKPVTKEKPCPVCGGDHKCSVGDGGLILCGRSEVAVEGFRHLGASKSDPQFHLFRVAEPPAKKEASKPTDWTAEASRFAARLSPAARTELARSLRLPESVFAALPLIGVSRTTTEGYAYTLHEVDGHRRIIGLSTRNPDGTKKMRPGGKRGLTVPANFAETVGPVLLVEGASDTLALTAAGLCAVGRPSNTGGVRHLAALLKDDARPIVVVGENDLKPGGAWPGRDGAIRTAAVLAKMLGRDVAWTLPPDDAKDVRAWLTAHVRSEDPPELWAEAGRELLSSLLAVRRSEVPPPPLPKIVLSVQEHLVNDAAIRSLEREPDLYQRAGSLTRVIVDPHQPGRVVKRPLAVRIETLPAPTIRERLTRTAEWFRIVVKKDSEEEVPAHPPEWCVAAVQARGDWPGLRRLEAVVEFPVLLPSGDVLATPGYNADNGLLYQPQYPVKLAIPDKPTHTDAVAAVQILNEVLHDFPLQSPAHRAAWFAALLTPLARFAYGGNTPLFLVDANVPGAGKGLLLNAIARILLDQSFPVSTYTHDKVEMRKLITTIAMEGDLLVLFDNLDGTFGNAALDAALTTTVWKDRLLGVNKQVCAPLWATWYATGNNVVLAGDLFRRVCPIRLESSHESPELQSEFRHKDLLGWVSEHRGELLSAALTILSGYVLAGKPPVDLPAWGGFEGWSNLVRQAIVWAGLTDPGETRQGTTRAGDVGTDAFRVLLHHWPTLDPDDVGLSAAQVIDRVYGPDRRSNVDVVRDALEQMLPKPTGQALGYKLRRHRRRIFNGKFLDHASQHKGDGTKWRVYAEERFRISPNDDRLDDPLEPSATVDDSQRPTVTTSLGDIGEMLHPDPPRTPDGRPIRR